LLENVKGLVSHDNGKTLEVILQTLQELGYYVNMEIYNSKRFFCTSKQRKDIFLMQTYKKH